jgi:hypothetical protein
MEKFLFYIASVNVVENDEKFGIEFAAPDSPAKIL